jgi:DNA polymerase I-like protein with 3'-5' exonuclease and polymerase domains
MAEKRGISEEKAQDIIDKYKAKAHVLSKWLEQNAAKAINQGCTTGMSGHYRFYQRNHLEISGDETHGEIKQKEFELESIQRQAKNHPIQSGCASLLKAVVGRMYLELRDGKSSGPNIYDAHFMLFVHDEIVVSTLPKHVEPVKQIMINCSKWAFKKFWGDVVDFPVKVTVAGYYKKD